MARISSKHWTCIVCGEESYGGVICFQCDGNEKNKQRESKGSITVKQSSYIEYLISKLDVQTTGRIFLEVIPDYDFDIENISANQAGAVISKLSELTEENNG